MQRLEVHLSGAYKFLIILGGVFTCGFLSLVLWLTARNWPRLLDDEGIVCRSGRRVRWSELTKVNRVTVVDAASGRRVTGRLELIFGKAKVKVVPQSLAEGQAVLDLLSAKLGPEATPG